MNKSSYVQTIEDLKGFIEEFFKGRNKKVKVILFGSRARGTNTVHSDVDLAIQSEEDISMELSLLKEEIEESLLPQKVDIVDLSKVGEDLREEV